MRHWLHNKEYWIATTAVLVVLSIALVIILQLASLHAPVLSFPTTTIKDQDCFDLENGKVVESTLPIFCADKGADFRIERDANHKNSLLQSDDATVAYTDLPYEAITQFTISTLSFTQDYADVPFDRVAVIHTAEDHYYKMRLITEPPGMVTFGKYGTVTFQWDKLS